LQLENLSSAQLVKLSMAVTKTIAELHHLVTLIKQGSNQ